MLLRAIHTLFKFLVRIAKVIVIGCVSMCFLMIAVSIIYSDVEKLAPFGWVDGFEACQRDLQVSRQSLNDDYITEIDERYFLAWEGSESDGIDSVRLCDTQEQNQTRSLRAYKPAAFSGNLVAITHHLCELRIVRIDDARRETFLSTSECNGRIQNLIWNDNLLAIAVGKGNPYLGFSALVIEVWDVPERRLIDSIDVGSVNPGELSFEDNVIRIGDLRFVVDSDE
jgi:hypothetical protein